LALPRTRRAAIPRAFVLWRDGAELCGLLIASSDATERARQQQECSIRDAAAAAH